MWRVGKKIKINVYEDDKPICQCHDAETALHIVQVMNRFAALSTEELKKCQASKHSSDSPLRGG